MWELGSTETRNVVYNCVTCMMNIGQEIGCNSLSFDYTELK